MPTLRSRSHAGPHQHVVLSPSTTRPYFFRVYNLQHYPPAQCWIKILMNHAEQHIWDYTEQAGDIWNGRWSTPALCDLLQDHAISRWPYTGLRLSQQCCSEHRLPYTQLDTLFSRDRMLIQRPPQSPSNSPARCLMIPNFRRCSRPEKCHIPGLDDLQSNTWFMSQGSKKKGSMNWTCV